MSWKALASVGAAIIGGAQQNKNIDKQLKAQSDENEKNRAYNLQLAKMQNKWNFNMWKMENAYNSPSAQMQRMAAAGLNPDMMYGGGVSGNLSASSPSMTSGAPSSPMDWSNLANKSTIGDKLLDSQLKQAQIDNINADTKKKGAETSVLTDAEEFRKEYNNGLLKLQNVEIAFKNKTLDLTDVQISKMQHEIGQIDASVDQINASISKINADMVNDRRLTDAQIEKIASEIGLTKAETESIAKQLPKILRNLDDEHELKIGNIGILKIQHSQAKFNAYMHGSFSEDDKEWRFSDRCLKGVVRFIDLFTSKPFQLD